MEKEKKRKLFDELMEAVEDINQWREGKIKLKTYFGNKSHGTIIQEKSDIENCTNPESSP